MVDKFGNPVDIGSLVVYSPRNADDAIQVGTVKRINEGMFSILTPWGRTVTRAHREIIAYTGNKP